MTSKNKPEKNLKLFNFPKDGKASKNVLNKGLLITFEGGEGSGKSTQCKRLVNKLVDDGVNSILIHEPGNTPMGEQVRKWIKSKNIKSSIAETYLFCAARAELCKSVIEPALDKGITVIVDRFIHSTVAYQGYGRGLNVDLIDSMNLFAIDKILPQLTIFFDIDPVTAFDRLVRKSLDRMELMGVEYLTKVREGYLKIMDLNPIRFKRINCNDLDIISVNNKVVSLLKLHLNKEI